MTAIEREMAAGIVGREGTSIQKGSSSSETPLPLERKLRLRCRAGRESEVKPMRRAAFDEMNCLDGHGPADIRSAYHRLKRWLDETPAEVFDARRSQAELFFRRIGITFAASV